MYSLGRRIEENAPLLAALAIIILNIVAVLGVWHPNGAALATLNAVGAAVLAFLVQGVPSLQSWGVRRGYQVRARSEARRLVPTAGAMIGQVVGRDDLCTVLVAHLRDRRSRPHLLVSGEGTGKTAVLVRLTELLADEGVVPVPVRLRDASYELDFEYLARERFLNEVNPYLVSSDEGETIWRQLRRDRKVAVLADGLETALIGSSAEMERDNLIRAAIRKAQQQRLPLVITSRPHDPLRATDAGILVLEPLSLGAALGYLGGDGTVQDDRRLAWIVETADVVEAPLYLQITRELHVKGLLEPSSTDQRGVVDTRGVDRSRLRLALLQTWERALILGHLYEDVPLNRAERQAAVEHISALACIGLKHNRLDVGFDDFADSGILVEVRRRLMRIDDQAGRTTGVGTVDARLAAAWAAQLELVELRGDGVRFPYSLMQAYLGSRLLDAALEDPRYLVEALQHPRPGREFLLALVLRSRASGQIRAPQPDPGRRQDRNRPKRARRADATSPQNGAAGVGLLAQAAAQRDDYKVLDMYAAALEIDCVTAEPAHTAIAEQITEKWPQIHAYDPMTLEEAKLGLIRRFGEAARAIDSRRRQGDSCCKSAYRQLYAITCAERSQAVQLVAAQEIGAGGASAYQALQPVLTAPSQICESERVGGYTNAAGGHISGPEDDNDNWRAWITSAWLAPMLVGSLDAAASGRARQSLKAQAQEDLAQWLRHVGLDARRPGEENLPISLEIALAQGFKYAANRRSPYIDTSREERMYLAEQALEMLKGARYWFSQLTLIQALCLLNMSDGPRRVGDKYGAKPEAIVQYWLDVVGRERADRVYTPGTVARVHPFVRESAQLAALALETGLPQRYCWIDESSAIAQVGSRSQSPSSVRFKDHSWIPRSAGWTALAGRAQQLLADVVLLLSLAERGDEPRDHERRLRRANRIDLPPCLTRFRPALNPGRTVGTAISSAPGTTCVDGCPFELCPYPPKGALPGMEMSEAFCRRQQSLLARNSFSNRKAPWQQMLRGQLIGFWGDMANRARGSLPRSR
jgi:hypothetical protein